MGIYIFSISAREQKLCPNKLKIGERGCHSFYFQILCQFDCDCTLASCTVSGDCLIDGYKSVTN